MTIFANFFRAIGGIFSGLWSVNPVLAVLVCIMAAAIFLIFCLRLIILFADIFEPGPPTVDSRIGYKRAWLEGDSFIGVVGVPYDVDEDAEGPGFHAYRSFTDARYHPQAGNVYLEVLLSGYIQEHELGYTASHQRVLQVIAGDCADCGKPATNYFLDRDLFASAPEFLCRRHSRLPSKVKPGLALQHLTNRVRRDSFDEPIEELANDFPWLARAGVVSASYAGPKAFIPTKLSSEEKLVKTQ